MATVVTSGSAYLNIGQIATLDRRHAATLIEFDLPDATEIRKKILNALASVDIPHLNRLLTARDDLASIMLKARDGTCMSRELALAFSILWVPYSQSAVGSGGDKPIIAKVQKTDKQGVTHERVKARASVEIPNLDKRVHRPRDAPIALVVEDDRVHFLGVAFHDMKLLAGADAPYADGAIVAARNKSVAVR